LAFLRQLIWTALSAVGLDVRRKRPPDDRWLVALDIDTVLDIGAHVGSFYAHLRSALPKATIHSFEPLADSYETLVKRGTGDARFWPHNYALGATAGQVEMHRSEFSPSSSVMEMGELHKAAYPFSAANAPVAIEMKRLDDVADALRLTGRVLVKIDVQGAESQVLDGGERTISGAQALIIETSYRSLYEGQPLFAELHDRLRSMGFSFHGNVQQMVDPRDGSILQADSLFLRDAD
jgi:FkbM family methyltransferase